MAGNRIRVRAPELRAAGGWLNTPEPLSLKALRGRVIVLDFWTGSCINCVHVLDELRPVEARWGDRLSIIGVHSPKFAHETAPAAVATAVRRNGIRHPVLDDSDLRVWGQYAVKAWPTLCVIDPSGYLVATFAGEGHAREIEELIGELLGAAPPAGPVTAAEVASGPGLSLPADAVLLPADRTGRDADSVLVADAARHDVVELAGDLETELRRFGSERATFAEPNGLTLLPTDLAAELGYDVVVADTAHHELLSLRLIDGRVELLADLRGRGLRTITGTVPDVMSPWAVAWWPALDRLVIAAAGVHLLLALDLRTGRLDRLAGTTVEGLRDGPARDGWLAQPSGLAVDGDRVWFVDAETSSLRRLDLDGTLHTVVGEGLFDFGFVDGPPAVARLQHPLGVTLLADRSLAVFDTFNGAVRRFDPASGLLTTVADGLAEPSGGFVRGPELIVVESAADRLTPVALSSVASRGPQREVVRVAPGAVTLSVTFSPPDGQVVDERFGPATRLDVSAEASVQGRGRTSELNRQLVLSGDAELLVAAQAASCDHDPSVANPACYLHRREWRLAVEVVADGAREIRLALTDQ